MIASLEPVSQSPWRWEERAEQWLDRPLGRFLDYGCGPGRFLALVQNRCAECHGVDVDGELIESTSAQHPRIAFHVIGLDGRTNFPDDYFDTVALLEVIEHVPDEHATLVEVARILKPSGTLLLTTPHRGLLTFLDPGNLKFVIPGLHRLVHTRILANKDRYRERFERARETGMIGDISVTSKRAPWHRHYTRQQIERLAPKELVPQKSCVYFPGMRALSLLRLIVRVLSAGRLRRLPTPLSNLERRLSHVESSSGDQLVMKFIKKSTRQP